MLPLNIFLDVNVYIFLDRRRSNVVKGVEKIAEDREKRRAQQAKIMEEQAGLNIWIKID